MQKTFFLFFLSLFIFCSSNIQEQKINKPISTNKIPIQIDSSNHNTYLWSTKALNENKLVNRIELPLGFKRVEVQKNSFADWLRNLPLKEGKPDVYLYNGQKKGNQNAHFAVVDINIGKRDLQQCADAVMRLRAEYLYSSNQKEKIEFKFTSGDNCKYTDWKNGVRPKISGNKVTFSKTTSIDKTYKTFGSYLNTIFNYCGTYSLEKELFKVNNISDLKSGDVFIMGGFPGHAVIVVDVAINAKTNKKIFLLAQSYMPAQNIHILRNPTNSTLSPWFSTKFEDILNTPEWQFKKTNLKSF